MIASKDHLPQATSKNELKVTVTISTDPTVHPKDVPVKGGVHWKLFYHAAVVQH